MGNNNRWSRENGTSWAKFLKRTLWRNKEDNPMMFDLLLLDLAQRERRLTLLLNAIAVNREGQRITGPPVYSGQRNLLSHSGRAVLRCHG